MDLEELFARLGGAVAEKRLTFRFVCGVFVRDAKGRCPLCALAWLQDPKFRAREAVWLPSALLGLPRQVADDVTFGADSVKAPLRARLLAACGLTEGGNG